MPAALFKKRFLKVLLESLVRMGKYVNYKALLRIGFHKYLRIKPLDNNEYQMALEAVEELERDEYIERVPVNGGLGFKLTPKGLIQAKKDIKDMKIASVFILDLDLRPALIRKIGNAYRAGDFEDVVFKATKYLEEKVRARAGLSPTDIGTALMDKAFSPKTGLLKCPLCLDESERSGLHSLFRGSVGFFKNPSSHRTVIYDDPNTTLQILGYVNILLGILDQCSLATAPVH